MLTDRNAKQAYDKGYDAGADDKAAGKPRNALANPYKPTRWGNGRDGMWYEGYNDGYAGRKRRISRDEHYAQLRAFRARALTAFAAHKLRCDCMGLSHDTTCPLGELEIEAGDSDGQEAACRDTSAV